MHTLRLIGVLAILSPFLGLAACSHNPVTGEKSLLFMSKSEEVALGAEAAPQFTGQFGGKVPNQQLQDYVTRVGRKLADQTEEDFPSFPWEFTLLNSDVINAFALPGGKVFITRGLASKMTNEAQLAGVLGHEVGHVTARHGNQRMSQAQIANLGLIAAQLGVGVASDGGTISTIGQYGIPALETGGKVVLLSYGRKDESQADELGMRYMSRAGYNPAAQRDVMQILLEASGSDGRGPEWLATHPFPETRIQLIDGLLAKQYPDAATNPSYHLYETEYREQFLRVLATVPAAPKAPEESGSAQGLKANDKKKR